MNAMFLRNLDHKEARIYKILYYLSIVAVPNIFVFNIYSRNSIFIQFNHILLLAAILTIVGFILGVSIVFLTRTYEGSFGIMLFWWLLFWYYESIFTFFLIRVPRFSETFFWIIICFVFACLITLVRSFSKNDKFQKSRMFFIAIFATTILVFLFNAFPATLTARSARTNAITEWELRRNFTVSPDLPSPSIYWFHVDGMISLDTAEYFSGVSQNKSRERLLDLGFVINEQAEIFTSNTFIGVPALLSPDFYDSYLHPLFMEGQHLLLERRPLYYEALERDNISLENDLAPYHELFHAFLQAGYYVIMIADFSPGVYTLIGEFYNLGSDYPFALKNSNSERHFLVGGIDLIELLVMMTPIPEFVLDRITGNIQWYAIPTHNDRIDELTMNSLNLPHERDLYRALIDSLEHSHPEIPTLTYMTLMFTHETGWGWHADENTEFGNSVIEEYSLAHEYALDIMFNMIELILEQDPNAVIIIQADHGIHLHDTLEFLPYEGFTEEEIFRLYNSVMSAVRIPEQYGGLEAPLAPLNITRELVNRFVGPNYELLSD